VDNTNVEKIKSTSENIELEAEIPKEIYDKKFKCDKCSRILSSNKILKNHTAICKGVSNILECHICHEILKNPTAKSRHIKNHIIEEPIVINNAIDKDINALDINTKIKTIHYKYHKIPQSVRISVWDTYIGRTIGETNCFVCNNIKISQFDFHCGHVIAEKNGGELSLSNLRPICKSCNCSMGTQNLNEYKEKYFKKE
jgi:5-methylcytosine-specific restriction endonuclease McrA